MISKPRRANGIHAVAFALLAVACSRDESAAPKPVQELAAGADRVSADDIPIAHTPPGGYGQTFPPPDGTVTNALHDVSVFDYETPVHAVASYEDGVFVLRPLLIPSIPVTFEKLEVTRRIDADGHMVWTRPDQGGLTITLERIGSATDTYTRTDTLRPEGGPPPGTPMWRYRLGMLWTLLTSS